jgi:hypothetical protein
MIVEEEQQEKERAGYGKKLLRIYRLRFPKNLEEVIPWIILKI